MRNAGATPDDAPLAGRTVAVTRPRERASALVTALESLGATVLAAPAIAVLPPTDFGALDTALHQLVAPPTPEDTFDWLVLTSAAAVDAVATRLTALGRRFPAEGRTRVGVVGLATAGAARLQLGRVDVVPPLHTAAGLAAALPRPLGARVLFPCADRARDALPSLLTARGARVCRVVAYRTVDAPPDALAEFATAAARGALDLVLVASPSAAQALVRALAGGGLAADACAAVCIGPTTANACRAHGLRVAAVAPEPTDDALVAVTLAFLTRDRHALPAR